jgi:hypothetical protein
MPEPCRAPVTPRRAACSRIAALGCALALAVCAAIAGASEVVYTWRDPQTGQLVLHTVPPPWLRTPATAAKGPHVNVFKDGKLVPPELVGAGGKVLEAPPGKPGGTQEGGAEKPPDLKDLLAKRDAALERLTGEALRVGPAAANEAFFVTLDGYLDFCAQADAVDPGGTATRNAERDEAMQRVKANLERVLRQPAPRTAFQNEATRWYSDKSDLAAQKIVRCLRDGYC